MSGFLSALPAFLTWQGDTSIVRAACSAHFSWVWNRLRAWSEAGDGRIWERVRHLPAPSQQRLLLAPTTFHLLRAATRPAAAQLARLSRFIDVEEHLAGGKGRGGPAGCWSAMGDYSWDASGTEVTDLDAGGSESSCPFWTARVGHTVLDACSPHDLILDGGRGELVRHTRSELVSVRKRIEEAVVYIQEMSGQAGMTIGNGIQVISLRKAAAHPDEPHSYSSRDLVGMIGLVNMHSSAWSKEGLAGALIHESVHQTLYKLELCADLFVDLERAYALTTVSPWTGRVLKISSFVHACFVWFGLVSFWCLPTHEGQGGRQLREQALHGFTGGPLLAPLSPGALSCVQPEVLEAIDALQQRALAMA